MKIEIKAINGVKEVPEDMKNAAIARKKAFAKNATPKKKAPKVKKNEKCILRRIHTRLVTEPTLSDMFDKPRKKKKIVAKVRKVITKKKKGNRHGKENRSKNL